jgi:hypothetical protein
MHAAPKCGVARETETTMNTNRTAIYLRDGRAWVAELKDGRARVSSLTAWLSAHPGRTALSLALEPLRCAPQVCAPCSRQARGGALAALLGRLLGRRTSSRVHPDAAVGR